MAAQNPTVWLIEERQNADRTYDPAAVASALKIQAQNEFNAVWNLTVLDVKYEPNKANPHNAPDWIIHLQDSLPQDLGYHTVESDANGNEQIVGYVSGGTGYTAWPITSSHELLEMLADPSPIACQAGVALEVCDPVENSSYNKATPSGASIPVSDFVFPSWFKLMTGPQTKFDYLDLSPGPLQLGSDGGYVISCSTGQIGIGKFNPGKTKLPPTAFRGKHNQLAWMLFTPEMRRMFRHWKGGLSMYASNTLDAFGFTMHDDPAVERVNAEKSEHEVRADQTEP